MSNVKTILIHKNDIHQRIDRYMRKYFPQLSLSRLHFLFRKKEIKVNKRAVKKNHLLKEGDELVCYGITPEESGNKLRKGVYPRWVPSFKLPVIFENQDLLVIDKPEGIAVHPGTGLSEGKTVIEMVNNYLGNQNGSLFKPALIHRLDKDTSGILMIAKTGDSLRWWTRQFREKKMSKYYYTLVSGKMKKSKGTIEYNLERVQSKKSGAKVLVNSKKGKVSLTHYEVEKRIGKFSLLRIRLLTGRTHQIRVHLQAEGKAIAGDRRYGDFELNKSLRLNFGLKRLFLHAFEIKGRGTNGEIIHFKSIIPKELSRLITDLNPINSK